MSRAAALPDTFHAQLATLVDHPPEGDGWGHELKYDGYRVACFRQGKTVRLITRNQNDWTKTFPELVDAAKALKVKSAVLDGEVCILLPDGRTSFQELQNAIARKPPRAGLVYFVFDLLQLDGEELSSRPLTARKERLQALLADAPQDGVLRYSAHVVGNGDAVFEQACRLGAEGIISKRLGDRYRPGRGSSWQKTKCVLRQEFVIGGFTEPEGRARQGLGALLVGYHTDDGRFAFAGKVGTGFTNQSARQLRQRLAPLEQKTCPFTPAPEGWLGKNAHWVKPQLLAEVTFGEWTRDGKIRHPSFQGVREDKPPARVVRERPKAQAQEVAGVRLSHPDRMFFPDIGLTKRGLAQFYEGIAEHALPHLRGRPLTLFRCPEEIGPDCYFMKHSKVWAPQALRRVRIQEKTKVGEYLIVDDVEALVSLVQMDVIEVHTWNSRDGHLEEPDRIVFDLDPGPKVPWRRVVEAAHGVRRALTALGLQSFVKTTGGVGLHVVVPLVPEADWKACLEFSRALAQAITAQDPKGFTTAFARAGREEKILIDYLRNNRTNTSVAAFSVRAREGAPISVPVHWDELTPKLRPNAFTVANLSRRLARVKVDPWAGYFRARQRLTDAALRAVRSLGGR